MPPVTLLDVNVVVSALCAEVSVHERSRSWLADQAQSGRAFGVTTETLVASVRLLSDSRIFLNPPSPAAASALVTELVASLDALIAGTSSHTWGAFSDLVHAVDVPHKCVHDALLAAVALEFDAALASFDRGFARYPGLRFESLSELGEDSRD
jgi:toxin-antitoxin system PIN domain toxin